MYISAPVFRKLLLLTLSLSPLTVTVAYTKFFNYIFYIVSASFFSNKCNFIRIALALINSYLTKIFQKLKLTQNVRQMTSKYNKLHVLKFNK